MVVRAIGVSSSAQATYFQTRASVISAKNSSWCRTCRAAARVRNGPKAAR